MLLMHMLVAHLYPSLTKLLHTFLQDFIYSQWENNKNNKNEENYTNFE